MATAQIKGGGTVVTTIEAKKSRKISLFQTVVLLYSGIGGPGLFIAMSTMGAHTGSVAMMVIMVFFCGWFNYSMAMCFTEVTVMLPKSGGPYFFVLKVFGNFAGFLFIWGFVFLITIPIWAAFAFGTSLNIVQLFFPGCRPPIDAVKLLAVTILVLVVALNCLYLQYVTKVQAVLSAAKGLAVLMIIIGGVVQACTGDTGHYDDVMAGSKTSPGEIAYSGLAGMFLFTGWVFVTFLMDEMEAPERNLPIALRIGFVLAFLLSELTILAYFVVISPTEMAENDATAVFFMTRLFRPLAPVLSLLVSCACLGSLNAGILAHSRLLVAVARANQLPFMFTLIQDKFKIALVSPFSLCILSILLIVFGNLQMFVEMASFYSIVMALSVLACLFKLRVSHPDQPRSIKVWLGTAVIQVVLNIAILVLCVHQNPPALGRFIVFMLCGIPVYCITIQWKSKPRAVHHTLERVTVFLQKLLILRPVNV